MILIFSILIVITVLVGSAITYATLRIKQADQQLHKVRREGFVEGKAFQDSNQKEQTYDDLKNAWKVYNINGVTDYEVDTVEERIKEKSERIRRHVAEESVDLQSVLLKESTAREGIHVDQNERINANTAVWSRRAVALEADVQREQNERNKEIANLTSTYKNAIRVREETNQKIINDINETQTNISNQLRFIGNDNLAHQQHMKNELGKLNAAHQTLTNEMNNADKEFVRRATELHTKSIVPTGTTIFGLGTQINHATDQNTRHQSAGNQLRSSIDSVYNAFTTQVSNVKQLINRLRTDGETRNNNLNSRAAFLKNKLDGHQPALTNAAATRQALETRTNATVAFGDVVKNVFEPTNTALNVKTKFNVQGNMIVMDSVGVGTAAPATPLDVRGNTLLQGNVQMNTPKLEVCDNAGGKCQVIYPQTQPKPVDCQVGPWSGWSICDKPCGTGSQYRVRSTVVAAANGGKACPNLIEQRDCNTKQCEVSIDCQVGEWSAWSACDKPCGSGFRTRTRKVLQEPLTGGRACPTLVERQACNTQACPPNVDCLVGPWSDWSACTQMCIDAKDCGVQKRTRAVIRHQLSNGKACGPLQEIKPCAKTLNINAETYVRRTILANIASPGTSSHNITRTGFYLLEAIGGGGGGGNQINGWVSGGGGGGGGYAAGVIWLTVNTRLTVVVGAGGSGSIASKSSDGGTGGVTIITNGTSNVELLRASGGQGGKGATSNTGGQGGAGTAHPTLNAVKIFKGGNGGNASNVTNIRHNGGGGGSSGNSGGEGFVGGSGVTPTGGMARSGVIQTGKGGDGYRGPHNGVKPPQTGQGIGAGGGGGNGKSNGQAGSAGAARITYITYTVNDCQFTWNNWTACDKPCGSGSQSRTAKVTRQALPGGNDCPAPEFQSCNTHRCAPVDCRVEWGPWGGCSASCGGGTQTRSVARIIQQPQNGGRACPTRETISCNTHRCPPVNCQFVWGSWSPCSASCGGGTQTRSPQIRQHPQNGGTACPASETQSCNTNSCLVPPVSNIIYKAGSGKQRAMTNAHFRVANKAFETYYPNNWIIHVNYSWITPPEIHVQLKGYFKGHLMLQRRLWGSTNWTDIGWRWVDGNNTFIIYKPKNPLNDLTEYSS
jgi:hypothetical protein